jgi:ATP-dependent DNA ligase
VHSSARHRSPFRSGLHSRSENGDRVRLFSRNGNEWTKRYPWIVEAARKIRQQQRFVLDGEAVVLGVDGIADFNALHSRQHDEEVQFCAFDILLQGGEDLRKLPLHLRKTSLARLLARRPEGSRESLRARRDRPRAFPRGLSNGPRGIGFKAQGATVYRVMEALRD